MSNEQPAQVHIRVTSNVDSLRRGWEGVVPLTGRVEALSLAGYVKILGHVSLPVVIPPPASMLSPAGKMVLPEEMEFEPVAPSLESPKPKRPSRRRPAPDVTPIGTEVDDGGSESSA